MSICCYSFRVIWSDLDADHCLAGAGYLEYAARARLQYFRERGFTPTRFMTQSLRPVIADETLRCRRALRLREPFRVGLTLGGLSADGSKFLVVSRFELEDGTPCAELFARGAWLDLRSRRLVRPPPALEDALRRLTREAAFERL